MPSSISSARPARPPLYARVYIALNTILTDRELDEAFSLIKSCAIGIDGLIIGTGILELRSPVPCSRARR